MKWSWKILLLGGLMVALPAWWIWSRARPVHLPAAVAKESRIAWRSGPPTKTVTDAGEIFKRAFWRRPGDGDEILHAERHEWSDADGLQRWQWFLVVKGSPGLIKYLRDDNAFGLVAANSAPATAEAPAWFQINQEEVVLLQSPQSGMRLMFCKSDNTLYATASGRGFSKGAAEPPARTQGAPAPGRIPTTLPPQPKP